MRLVFTSIVAVVLVIFSCKKNNYETRPSIRIKGTNTNEVLPGGTLQVSLEYTDKEGDLADGVVTYIRDRTNIRPIPNPGSNDIVDTVRYTIPTFPDKSKAEIQVNIPYNFMNEDPGDNDTMVFRFTVQDIKGNKSDTVQTEKVVARQN